VAGARTTAAVVVLVVALWTLVILARPLHAWKVALIATMAGLAAAVVLVPPLADGIFLLRVTPQTVLTGVVLGAGGALLVEISSRVFRASPAAPRTRSAPAR
jgi:cation-transporting ATPase E